MEKQQLKIAFDNCEASEANVFANALEDYLRDADQSVAVSTEKERPDSQDFGATLVILFGTPVAVALANAVTTFLQRNSGASITISKNGHVVGKNLDSSDAAKIAQAFGQRA